MRWRLQREFRHPVGPGKWAVDLTDAEPDTKSDTNSDSEPDTESDSKSEPNTDAYATASGTSAAGTAHCAGAAALWGLRFRPSRARME